MKVTMGVIEAYTQPYNDIIYLDYLYVGSSICKQYFQSRTRASYSCSITSFCVGSGEVIASLLCAGFMTHDSLATQPPCITRSNYCDIYRTSHSGTAPQKSLCALFWDLRCKHAE